MHGRGIGLLVVAALCIGVFGGLAIWGMSGAIVVATLTVGGAAILSAAERADAEVGDRATQWRLGAWSVIPDGASHEVGTAAIPSVTPELHTPRLPTFPERLRRHLSIVRVQTPRELATLAFVASLATLVLVIYLRDIGANPAGLFCDEAEIGLEAYRMLHGHADVTSVPLFYHHFGYDLGFLGPLATAPFVAIFGLDDAGVRISAAMLSLIMLATIYATLRRLKIPYAAVAVAFYAFSPIVLHLSRVNFGHAPSMLLIAVGFDRFVVARQSGRRTPAMIAGVLLGASAYGNPSFYVAGPLIIGAIGISEVFYNRRQWHAYTTYGLTAGFAAAWGLPLVFLALTDETFWRRFNEKNAFNAPWFTMERFRQLVENYPKYFSKAFLFDVGEVGLPGGFISRHSVAGAGELSEVALPFVLVGLIAVYLLRHDHSARFILPWGIVAVMYPLPDLISTSSDRPPYTLSLFGTSLCLPYLAGWCLRGLQAFGEGQVRWDDVLPRRLRALFGLATKSGEPVQSQRAAAYPMFAPISAGVLLLWVVIAGWRFYEGPYRHYPEVSADYWGWQYGPRQMIAYFLEHKDEYDEFIMDGNFNEAYIFLDFYIRDPDVRRRASIGDLSRLDPTKRQLFGIRSETWNRLPGTQVPSKSYMVIDEVIPYPNGNDAMYLMELR
jgi:hypothetical protein